MTPGLKPVGQNVTQIFNTGSASVGLVFMYYTLWQTFKKYYFQPYFNFFKIWLPPPQCNSGSPGQLGLKKIAKSKCIIFFSPLKSIYVAMTLTKTFKMCRLYSRQFLLRKPCITLKLSKIGSGWVEWTIIYQVLYMWDK